MIQVRCATTVALVTLLALSSAAQAQPTGCIPPLAPYLPSDPRDVRDYADLIGDDFESYIDDFEAYMACLDLERARVFAEAQEVTADYGRFLQLRNRLGPPHE